MVDDLVKIASQGAFTLYERTSVSTEQWKNLKLVRKGKAQKNNWWLGWNGKRLAVNHDEKKLKDHEPGIWQWVFDQMKNRA